MKVGELFVSLGFDVDEKPLNSFQTGLEKTTSSLLKIAGISLGASGIAAMFGSASQSSVAVDNISRKFGVATEEVQRFTNAFLGSNAAMNRGEALAAYAKISRYISEMPTKGAKALQFFEGTAADNTVEKVLERMREGLPGLIKRRDLGFALQLIQEITGTEATINSLQKTTEEFNRLGGVGITSKEDIENNVLYAESVQKIDTQLTDLKATYLSLPAKGIANLLADINKHGFLYGARQLVTGVGRGVSAGQERLADFFSDEPAAEPAPARRVGGSKEAKAKSFFQSMGWSENQSSGMVRRLIAESNLSETAVGDGGSAYGIAQWHPNRQEDFKKFSKGKDIRDSTFMEQAAFVNYELTKGKERGEGNLLRRMESESDAYRVFTNNYERPAGTKRVVQNFYTTGDTSELAQQALRAFQQTDIGTNY